MQCTYKPCITHRELFCLTALFRNIRTYTFKKWGTGAKQIGLGPPYAMVRQ